MNSKDKNNSEAAKTKTIQKLLIKYTAEAFRITSERFNDW